MVRKAGERIWRMLPFTTSILEMGTLCLRCLMATEVTLSLIIGAEVSEYVRDVFINVLKGTAEYQKK